MSDKHNNSAEPEHEDPIDDSLRERTLRTLKYNDKASSKLMEAALTLIKVNEAQQKQNKWRMLFWALPVVFVILYAMKQSYDNNNFYDKEKGYVAQVVLSGEIKIGSKSASADWIIPSLRAAFADDKAKGVLLRISSPGGSPNQSILIHDEIVKLKTQYPNKKFTVIGEESLTSGAYWIASASDTINVLPATLTGSIGVIFSSFNVSKLAERFDIKRQIVTAGKNKSRIDPFIEVTEDSLNKLKVVADGLHVQFIDVVSKSRGDRLVGDKEELFSGDFWLGTTAFELGLVDRVTSTTELMNDFYGTDSVKNYSAPPSLLASLGFNTKNTISLPEMGYSLKVIEPLAMSY